MIVLSHQAQTEVYIEDGVLWIRQENEGMERDADVVGVAVENVERFIAAMEKAVAEQKDA